MNAHPGALYLASRIVAKRSRPRPPVCFHDWLTENIKLVDGPRKGEFWSAEGAPYLKEIADCLDLSDPSNLVTVRKCQQSGVSILALAWCLYLADQAPDNMLYAVPGIDPLKDMNNGKFQPLINVWQRTTGKSVVKPTVSRSGEGSTTFEKALADGSRIYLGNANTVMDLSSKTCRYGVKDEVSKWTELPNGADPETLFFGRFTAFRREKSYKIFELSTPELDSGDEMGEAPGHCRVDRSFKKSDQRYWNIACPQCAHEFVQTFDLLVIDREDPDNSVLGCPECNYPISEAERVSAVRAGRFIKTHHEPDRHPGFHVDAFMSLMMSYGDIAADFIAAEGKGETGEKDFSNLVLALPHEMKGNAPDHKRLMERREDYPENIIPEPGLIFVGGADVQHYGIYVEYVAFAEDRQSWTVTARFLEGDTSDASAGAWVLLSEIYAETFEDAFGNLRSVERMAVDAGDGNRVNQVLEWTRRHANAIAIKGMHGRGVPAIGQPSRKSIRKSGRKKKSGSAMSWPVGTWGLKGTFYGNLHKAGMKSGEPVDPGGYCHFGTFLDEEYFKQITAEYFEQKMVNGKFHAEWKKRRRDNHFLDTRIYAMACAELLGLSTLTKDGWAQLRSRYENPTPTDLFSAPSEHIKADARQKAQTAVEKEKQNDGPSKWARRLN
ncbi:MAG: phage terminase large subunit family protein [Rhizobiaceae bacterium]|nr:phage terminase large subunit family protein [Rhizobiaceae bacterium]